MKRLLAFILTACAALAHAAPPPAVSNQPTGFVPIENANRVFVFPEARHQVRTDGVLLVCPLEVRYAGEKTVNGAERKICYKDDDESNTVKTDKYWKPLEEMKLSGFELAGIQYAAVYKSIVLIVYFRKIQPK